MATGDRDDPLQAFNFIIDFQGMRAGFSEATGISTGDTGVIEYREGSATGVISKIPGLTKQEPLVLKRGFTEKGVDAWFWRKTVLDGQTERRDGVVILLDEGRKPKVTWSVDQAWISKLTGPALNATENKVAIEEITIQHEGLRRLA